MHRQTFKTTLSERWGGGGGKGEGKHQFCDAVCVPFWFAGLSQLVFSGVVARHFSGNPLMYYSSQTPQSRRDVDLKLKGLIRSIELKIYFIHSDLRC